MFCRLSTLCRLNSSLSARCLPRPQLLAVLLAHILIGSSHSLTRTSPKSPAHTNPAATKANFFIIITFLNKEKVIPQMTSPSFISCLISSGWSTLSSFISWIVDLSHPFSYRPHFRTANDIIDTFVFFSFYHRWSGVRNETKTCCA